MKDVDEPCTLQTNIAAPESSELTGPRSVWFDSPLIGTAFVGQGLPLSGVCQGHGKRFKVSLIYIKLNKGRSGSQDSSIFLSFLS